jgi:hypothetical protein
VDGYRGKGGKGREGKDKPSVSFFQYHLQLNVNLDDGYCRSRPRTTTVRRYLIMTILLWTNNYPVLYLTECCNKRSGAPLPLPVPSTLLYCNISHANPPLSSSHDSQMPVHTCCPVDQVLSVAIRGRGMESLRALCQNVPHYPTASHELDTTAALHASGSVSPNNSGSE